MYAIENLPNFVIVFPRWGNRIITNQDFFTEPKNSFNHVFD